MSYYLWERKEGLEGGIKSLQDRVKSCRELFLEIELSFNKGVDDRYVEVLWGSNGYWIFFLNRSF